jgi:uncharacterized membrane protein HdeD (DUF308 family)
MLPEPRYSAARAANVVLAMATAAAVLCITAGVLYLRQGSSTGWLLIVLGVLPLAFAVIIRARVKRPPN